MAVCPDSELSGEHITVPARVLEDNEAPTETSTGPCTCKVGLHSKQAVSQQCAHIPSAEGNQNQSPQKKSWQNGLDPQLPVFLIATVLI